MRKVFKPRIAGAEPYSKAEAAASALPGVYKEESD